MPVRKGQTEYKLVPYLQILVEDTSVYTIEEITHPSLQAKFQAFPNHNLDLQNYKYYWAKIQLENRMTAAKKQYRVGALVLE